ncbi:MAG: aminotransferase class I/II-fold pyridoxal phosphate-dependent enzyme [Chloroflexi bacterium]|nr:aminotransferase class I/II-fold pyridoxal phosphate-dependent enzyme [Chloroflexota bacterium]BCY18460.1 LL-diaminopimelate aminotransferase [Leptolinea sp. HRD-7]
MNYIQPAHRIAGFKPYFFATLNQKINELKKKGVSIIRLDMGSPDLPPTDEIIDVMVKASRDPHQHGYSAIGGTPQFKQACADYYLKRFNVTLDPSKEILALVGSKEGIFNLSQVILNPGDISLVPDPGYPAYREGGKIAGAELYDVPLLAKNHFLPDLAAIPDDILEKAKILWLNYPNNPTGAVAPLSFFEKAVRFAHDHQILIAHDAPYTDICFGGYVAPSILEVDGAKDVAVEFNSLSKTYNMAGWRVGMAVGNSEVIRYLSIYKSQMDSSQFNPILAAGIHALTSDQEWIQDRNDIYLERRDIVVKGLAECGFDVEAPEAAIYVWAHLPQGISDSASFCSKLLEETGVSMTPGIVYGKHGEGFIRISLGTATNEVKEALDRVRAWMKKA